MSRRKLVAFSMLWERTALELVLCNKLSAIILDGFVKSPQIPFFVIPAKAGIQSFQAVANHLDSGFTGVTTFYECIILEAHLFSKSQYVTISLIFINIGYQSQLKGIDSSADAGVFLKRGYRQVLAIFLPMQTQLFVKNCFKRQVCSMFNQICCKGAFFFKPFSIRQTFPG